jgi:hypothetical protein
MGRVTQRLWRGVRRACPEHRRGNLGRASFTPAERSFSTTEARHQDLLRYAQDSPGYFSEKPLRARCLKSSEQQGAIKRPRGPSTPRHKRCVTRPIYEALRSG